MGTTGVFFDLYGTLFVSSDPDADWRAWGAGFEAALASHGFRLSETARSELSEHFMLRSRAPDVTGGFTLYEQRVHDFLRDAGLAPSATAVRDTAQGAAEAWHEGFGLDPEAPPLFDRLRARGLRIALVSNFDHPPLLRARLAEAGIAEAFDVIVVSAEVGVEKPDPAIFRPALEGTRARPEDVVHVGDSAADIDGARAAGIRPVFIGRPGAPPVHDLDGAARIERLSELPDLL